ncbi:MAG: hypothetical protein ACLTXI_00465 [Collinsella sp.]
MGQFKRAFVFIIAMIVSLVLLRHRLLLMNLREFLLKILGAFKMVSQLLLKKTPKMPEFQRIRSAGYLTVPLLRVSM